MKNIKSMNISPDHMGIMGNNLDKTKDYWHHKDWYNFKELEVFLKRQFSFAIIEGLEASFKGLAPKKAARTKVKKEEKNHLQQPKAKRNTGVKKRFDVSQQEGFEPFRLPKNKRTLPIDDSED